MNVKINVMINSIDSSFSPMPDADDSLMDADTFKSLGFQPLHDSGGLLQGESQGSQSDAEDKETIVNDEPALKRRKIEGDRDEDEEGKDEPWVDRVAGDSTKSANIGTGNNVDARNNNANANAWKTRRKSLK
jgi:hypothetical protein